MKHVKMMGNTSGPNTYTELVGVMAVAAGRDALNNSVYIKVRRMTLYSVPDLASPQFLWDIKTS